MGNWHEWSPCEWAGHRFSFVDADGQRSEVFDVCVDCGEPREKDDDS